MWQCGTAKMWRVEGCICRKLRCGNVEKLGLNVEVWECGKMVKWKVNESKY